MGRPKKQEPVLNREGTHVYLHNPETDGVWECPVDVADLFVERRGWEYTTAPDTALDNLFDPVAAQTPQFEQTGFNPDEHGVDEVNAHLAKYARTAPGEVARVLQLERGGQNRKTVVDPFAEADTSTTPSTSNPTTGD